MMEELTHGPEELLVEFKGHERAGQVAEPLFEDAGDDVDVVVVQVHAVHIWKGTVWPGKGQRSGLYLFLRMFNFKKGQEEDRRRRLNSYGTNLKRERFGLSEDFYIGERSTCCPLHAVH